MWAPESSAEGFIIAIVLISGRMISAARRRRITGA
jgi:hypothetical protein